MKRTLLLVLTCLVVTFANSQEFSAKNFFSSNQLSQKKLETYLNKNRFILSGSRSRGDSIVHTYTQKPNKNKSNEFEVKRIIETYEVKGEHYFALFTSSPDEFSQTCSALKEQGFFCGSGATSGALLFQRKNVSVIARKAGNREGELGSFFFSEIKLPFAKEIEYTDDLLALNSHEQLVSVFGEENVIRDVYYFSDKEFSRSSVLFPRTRHQVVFIWEDEENYRFSTHVMIGGNMNTGSSSGYDGLIEENDWTSREGIYPGMSLADLLRLNGSDFKFYGKKSAFPFMIVPENTGKLNFRQSNIVLGCLDPAGTPLLNNEVISAREILSENPGLYVFMLMLDPTRNRVLQDKSVSLK